MGGVDLSDALIGYYSILHKTRRWYRSFFYHFVDIGIVNAFILHKEVAKSRGEKPMTQKAFRECLVEQLHEAGTTRVPPTPPEPVAVPPQLHMPEYLGTDGTQSRRQCKICKQKTPIHCSSCDVSLCLVPSRNCFRQWHVQYEL